MWRRKGFSIWKKIFKSRVAPAKEANVKAIIVNVAVLGRNVVPNADVLAAKIKPTNRKQEIKAES
jgi:hypothetical protein